MKTLHSFRHAKGCQLWTDMIPCCCLFRCRTCFYWTWSWLGLGTTVESIADNVRQTENMSTRRIYLVSS
ncbi:hypothetical protein vseg_002869 [Gypsophila vaccaria]